ncbi:hypothetical protein, partial [Bradyrhizobium sp. STM 3809]|uniref:hypothetical protein n=1 Tax=Bradyrhizobium sp. STM 3809 TaxID=551936 RepID=UPI001AEBE8FE
MLIWRRDQEIYVLANLLTTFRAKALICPTEARRRFAPRQAIRSITNFFYNHRFYCSQKTIILQIYLRSLPVSRQKPLSAVSRAKNSLRPFFNLRHEQGFRSKRPPSFWKQIQAVRQETAPSDYRAICSVVEDNPAYPFSGLGNTFPTEEELIPDPA